MLSSSFFPSSFLSGDTQWTESEFGTISSSFLRPFPHFSRVWMFNFLLRLVRLVAGIFKSRAALHFENIALRHQLCVLQRSVKKPKIRPSDRILWSVLSRVWSDWKEALIFVKPDTVIRWQRKRFKEHWPRLSRSGKPGRPSSSLRSRYCDGEAATGISLGAPAGEPSTGCVRRTGWAYRNCPPRAW